MAGPSITEHEINKVSQMMRDGWDSYQYVEEFEERSQNIIIENIVNDTVLYSAIHLVLLALDIKR